MKFITNEELYDCVLKEIQKWLVERYSGKIFQSFTREARKMVGVIPCVILPIKEDNIRVYREFYNSSGMIVVIKITDKQTNLVVFTKSSVYYNDSDYSVVYNLRIVEGNISRNIDKMVISNDPD